MPSSKAVLFSAVFLSAYTLAAPAHAYLDPGTGSILLQLLFGGVAGALIVGKLYWQRMKDFFGGARPEEEPAAGAPDHE